MLFYEVKVLLGVLFPYIFSVPRYEYLYIWLTTTIFQQKWDQLVLNNWLWSTFQKSALKRPYLSGGGLQALVCERYGRYLSRKLFTSQKSNLTLKKATYLDKSNLPWKKQLTLKKVIYLEKSSLPWKKQLALKKVTHFEKSNLLWKKQLTLKKATYLEKSNLPWNKQLTAYLYE